LSLNMRSLWWYVNEVHAKTLFNLNIVLHAAFWVELEVLVANCEPETVLCVPANG
jgi:hypothetical protein